MVLIFGKDFKGILLCPMNRFGALTIFDCLQLSALTLDSSKD